jgi:hypothetical protein
MQKEMTENNPILKLSFDFSLTVIEYCKQLEERRKFVQKLEEIGKILNKILSTAKRKNPLSYLLSFFIF